MRKLYILCVLSLFSDLSRANEPRPAQITFRVMDDFGKPVRGVGVVMSTFLRWQPSEGFGKDIYEKFDGITDEQGFVTISAQSQLGDFAYMPNAGAAYYRGGGGNYHFKETKDGRWVPWNPLVEVTVRPIIKPVPMYARKVGELVNPLEIPVINKPIGFDLMVGDWVAPFGKGQVPDFVLSLRELVALSDVDKAFDYALTIAFSNEGDGIQSVIVPLEGRSEFKLPRYAPESGYLPKLEKQAGRPSEGKPINTSVHEDRNYFFRVRTLLDENGRIKSALYGKISGDVQFWGNRRLRFIYYLNPDSLDRNMEFNPQRNRFEALSSLEKPNEP